MHSFTAGSGGQIREQRLPFGASSARTLYSYVGWLFTASVILQVFFAGLGVLVDSGYWLFHITFGGFAVYFPLIMLTLAFIGRISRHLTALTGLLFLLYVLQWILIFTPYDLGLPVLRALHPVNALVIFWLAAYLAQQGRARLRVTD